jgi:hypothetical protein
MQLQHTLAFPIESILANKCRALSKSGLVDFFTIEGAAKDSSGLLIGIGD